MRKNKATYYIKRIKEAPLKVVVRKFNALLKKRLFWFFYHGKRIGLFPCPSSKIESASENIKSLGNDVRKGLVVASENEIWRKDAVKRARGVLNLDFQILGYGIVRIEGGASWHQDRIHGFTWPVDYFDSIDFVAIDDICDVKVPWELSRFQYLLWLAEGYQLDIENQSRYVELFETIVDDWIDANPPGFGVNWIVSMEVAIRACNLAIATSAFSLSIKPKLVSKIVRSLHDHFDYICRFPEFSDVSGNHYLSNLMGTSVISSVLFGDAALETSVMRAVFFEEADRQFDADGCHLERAPVYHRLCLDMVAIVLAFESRAGKSSDIGLDVLSRGLVFCRAISSSAQLLPVIGDCDSGHILWFEENARSFSGLEAFELSVQGKIATVPKVDSNTIWHLAIARMPELPVSSEIDCWQAPSRVKDLSGFVSGHGGAIDCVMRVGEQGLMGRASHDHDDALSIWVSENGRDFIVEQGCHSYTLDRVIRNSNIVSSGHNLVQPFGGSRTKTAVGSIVQTVVGAATAKSWSAKASAGSFILSAELNTSPRIDGVFSYLTREITSNVGDSTSLIVTDDWAWSNGQHQSELRWHFAPTVAIKLSSARDDLVLLIDKTGQIICELSFECILPNELEVFEFDFSEKYGELTPSTGLQVIISSHEKCKFTSKFDFCSDEQLISNA